MGTPDDSVKTPSVPVSTQDTDAHTMAGGQVLLRSPPTEVVFSRGDLLAGRYQVEKVIGHGATGCVLQAYDRVVRGVVAMKILKPELAADPRWVERLGGELRYARKLQHRNVCTLYEIGESDGHHFLTMEFASGGSLRQRLSGDPPPLEQRIADARSVVDGLAAIHAAQIVHRDVKPENVLVMEDGRLVVSDFGLAVTLGHSTFFSSQVAGTPTYMAPEVVFGEKATPAADVWSLGVVLHEVLFRKRPEWETTKQGRTLRPPASKDSSTRERALAELVGACLVELPTRRLPDAGAVKERLEGAVTGRRPPRRGLATLGVATVLLLAGAASLWAWRRGTKSPPLIVGTPRDLENGARVLLRTKRPIECLSVLPGGDRARIKLGAPPELKELDLQTNEMTAAPLVPDAFRSGCPELSPRGDLLAYVASKDKARLEIMISSADDGAQGQAIAEGSDPVWLPNGKELLYTEMDASRVAFLGLGSRPVLLQETAPLKKTVVDKAVDATGTVAAIVFRDASASYIEVYDLPSATLRRSLKVPNPVYSLTFNDRNLRVVADSPLLGELLELSPNDTRLTRVGRVSGKSIARAYPTPHGLLVYAWRREAIITVDGQEVLRGTHIHAADVNSRGDVLLEQRLPTGENVVTIATRGFRKRLTDGPNDRSPVFGPDGRSFVFYAADRPAMAVCHLSATYQGSCSTVFEERMAPSEITVSPDGSAVAYVVTRGTRRLRVASLRGGEPRDLGPVEGACPPRWSTATSIVMEDAVKSAALEIDIRSGTRAATPSSGGRCRAEPSRSRLKTSVERSHEIFLTSK